jgi:hypothetical protein
MARVQGVREKVHLPIYDALTVEPEKQLRDVESSSTLKFFVNVQNKTKLQTNLQSASLLPHYNTFEARAMRVVISDLPPEFPEEPEGELKELDVITGDDRALRIDVNGLAAPPLAGPAVTPNPAPGGAGDVPAGTVFNPNDLMFATVTLGLKDMMSKLAEAREGEGEVEFDVDDEAVELTKKNGDPVTTFARQRAINAKSIVVLSVADLEEMIEDLEKKAPPKQQIRPDNGAGNLISSFIYNTVTTFFVGEKVMIQMPTWFFPGGAGPFSEASRFTTHGEPTPLATFRFAEPIYIDKQQNFRVEIEIPDSDVLKELQKIYGPFNVWVVLDGFMTRDVQ